MKLSHFSQIEYSRILDINDARNKDLSQSECENILVAAGATAMQAKNGACLCVFAPWIKNISDSKSILLRI